MPTILWQLARCKHPSRPQHAGLRCPNPVQSLCHSCVHAVGFPIRPTHRHIGVEAACFDVDTGPTKVRLNDQKYWHITRPGESYSNTKKRLGEKEGCFSHIRLHAEKPSCTLTSNLQTVTHWKYPRQLNFNEVKRIGSFPDDYQAKSDNIGKYMIGMSVPPKMTEQVARAVIDQRLLPAGLSNA